MNKALLTILTIFILALSTPVKAQSFEDGSKAYDVGDYSRAFEIWLPLAERGDAGVQTLIGAMYKEGNGVPQDYAEAMRWYRMAAEQGLARPAFYIGVMYYKGQSVQQNYQEAARWYRIAAERGYARGQHLLGMMYATGQGVLQNYVTSHMWYNIANANGETEAIKLLNALNDLLNQDQILEAQARARKCFNSNYQDCD